MAEEIQDRLLELQEEYERKRAELVAALRESLVSDPFTATVLGSVLAAKILGAIAISAVLTIGTAFVTRALTPRQKFSTGAMQGALQIPQSDQGLPIIEGYGADPASQASVFQASHAYALEDRVLPLGGNGYFYVVTTAGTSAGTAPTFPTTIGASVTSGTAVLTNYGRTGGGFKLGMLIVFTSGVRKHTTTTRGGGGGKGPKPPEQTTISYDIDLALMPGRGPLRIRRITANTKHIYDTIGQNQTGVIDPTVDPDDDYGPELPPGALVPYTRPTDRYSGALAMDAEGVESGTIVGGSHANIAIYPGNTTQLPDPTMQAAIDALYGADSTPAFHNRCLVVLKNFFLTDYGGAIPIINFVAEHQEIDTFEAFCDSMAGRVGVLEATDYDFTALRRIFIRGFPVTPLFQPSEVMDALAEIFNVYFYEADKIYGAVRGGAVADTITDENVGWIDGSEDADEDSALQTVDATIEAETEIARKVSIKFINPDKGFEQNSQSDARQITSSEKVDGYELPLTLYPEEGRAITQRELYEEEIESTGHEFSTDWSKLWWTPGMSVEVELESGLTHRIFITDFNPCVGVIPVKGRAEETAVFTQPVTTSGGGVFEEPPVPIPGMTIMGVYDGPLLTDEHNTINNGSGMYVWATKRRGDGDFGGSALYVDKGLGFDLIETFEKEATFGVTASVLTATTTVHDVVADTVTVDLHTEDTLESVTRADLMAGANACIIGDEVCQILTAEREPDTVTYPNRWYLVIGLRSRRGTDFAINDHTTDERFVLVNDALKFLPLNLNDLNVERTYKMVTANQSLDDAANVTYVWTGGSRKELSPVHAKRSDDSAGNSLIEFDERQRLGHGVHNGQSGFGDTDVRRFEFELTDISHVPLDPPLVIPVTVGEVQRAVLESHGEDASWSGKFTNITINTVAVSGSVVTRTVRALQQIRQEGNYAEATLKATGNGIAAIGFHAASKDWRTDEPDFQILVDASVMEIYEGTTLLYTESSTSYATAGKRVRIDLIGSRVVFSRYVGERLIEVASSIVPATFPLHVWGNVATGSSGTASINDLVLTTTPDPKAILTQAQKTEYGIGPTVYANIYRISPLVGRGYPAEVVLEDSL
jgi:hypothetical protein